MSALKAAVDSEVGLAGGPAKALLVGIGLGGCAAADLPSLILLLLNVTARRPSRNTAGAAGTSV